MSDQWKKQFWENVTAYSDGPPLLQEVYKGSANMAVVWIDLNVVQPLQSENAALKERVAELEQALKEIEGLTVIELNPDDDFNNMEIIDNQFIKIYNKAKEVLNRAARFVSQ